MFKAPGKRTHIKGLRKTFWKNLTFQKEHQEIPSPAILGGCQELLNSGHNHKKLGGEHCQDALTMELPGAGHCLPSRLCPVPGTVLDIYCTWRKYLMKKLTTTQTQCGCFSSFLTNIYRWQTRHQNQCKTQNLINVLSLFSSLSWDTEL